MKLKTGVPQTRYHVECVREDGSLAWVEDIENGVTDAGINDLIVQYFKGANYSAAWSIGIINSPATLSNGDLMSAHGGWTENVSYSEPSRPALVLGAVAAKQADNTAAKAEFTATGALTIAGFFLCSNNVKNGTAGVLYATAAFSSGAKAVASGEVLRVTATVAGA